MNIPIYFLFYFLIIFSVIGYGQFLCSITNSKNISENFGYSGLLGLFFLTIYSYISNFFIAHNLTHNSILVLYRLYNLSVTLPLMPFDTSLSSMFIAGITPAKVPVIKASSALYTSFKV